MNGRRSIPAMLLAALAAGAGAFIALHHPLAPLAISVGFFAWMTLAYRFADCWLFVLPAALPVASLSPWTGWVGLDEFDLLALGAIAAAWLHAATGPPVPAPTPSAQGVRASVGCAAGFAVVGGIGALHGWVDAGAGAFDWFQGHADPLNTVRVAKPTLYAAALWLPTQRAIRRDPGGALNRIGVGMTVGLALVSLAALRERSAYPGLLDFVAPYRITAWFWEMHVGGAAIDVYLALALPFAAWALWAARGVLQWSAAAALAILAVHACLTTFSRGVYLAVGVPLLGLSVWLVVRHSRSTGGAWLRRLLAGCAVFAVATALLVVAYDQSGIGGFSGAALLLLVLLAVRPIIRNRRGVSTHQPHAGFFVLALALLVEAVVVLGPGSFMQRRIDTTPREFGGRLAHWHRGLALLDSPAAWLFGIGIGRLPARLAATGPPHEFSGSAAWRPGSAVGAGRVVLQGPRTDRRLEGLYGLTQRVPLGNGGPYRIELDFQASAAGNLNVLVCEMHLLYAERCQSAAIRVANADAGRWLRVDLPLRGERLTTGRWWAPRAGVLWLSVATAGVTMQIDNIDLRGSLKAGLARNGGFDRGIGEWLPVAVHHFLPWHIDNLALELLIEHGLLGVGCFLGCVVFTLTAVRTASRATPTGRPQQLPTAFFVASLGGGLLTGLVSSVLDAPRTAFLLMWLLPTLISIASIARTYRRFPHTSGDSR